MNHVQTFPATEVASPVEAAASGTGQRRFWDRANRVLAIGGIVLKEMYRRKDFYVLFILTGLITIVMGSVSFFNDHNITRYLKEITLLLIWVSSLVIAISTTARQLPIEREQRTIFPLLAKPVSRHEIVVGKFWGCWLASGMALVVFYLFFVLVSGAREHDWALVNSFQALALHWFMLGILIAITLLGSIVFAAPSSNGTITFLFALGVLLLGRHLNTLALRLPEPGQSIVYALYFIIPHLELFDVRDLIVHHWESIPWFICAGAMAYALVYMVFFLVLACLFFRRKSLN